MKNDEILKFSIKIDGESKKLLCCNVFRTWRISELLNIICGKVEIELDDVIVIYRRKNIKLLPNIKFGNIYEENNNLLEVFIIKKEATKFEQFLHKVHNSKNLLIEEDLNVKYSYLLYKVPNNIILNKFSNFNSNVQNFHLDNSVKLYLNNLSLNYPLYNRIKINDNYIFNSWWFNNFYNLNTETIEINVRSSFNVLNFQQNNKLRCLILKVSNYFERNQFSYIFLSFQLSFGYNLQRLKVLKLNNVEFSLINYILKYSYHLERLSLTNCYESKTNEERYVFLGKLCYLSYLKLSYSNIENFFPIIEKFTFILMNHKQLNLRIKINSNYVHHYFSFNRLRKLLVDSGFYNYIGSISLDLKCNFDDVNSFHLFQSIFKQIRLRPFTKFTNNLLYSLLCIEENSIMNINNKLIDFKLGYSDIDNKLFDNDLFNKWCLNNKLIRLNLSNNKFITDNAFLIKFNDNELPIIDLGGNYKINDFYSILSRKYEKLRNIKINSHFKEIIYDRKSCEINDSSSNLNIPSFESFKKFFILFFNSEKGSSIKKLKVTDFFYDKNLKCYEKLFLILSTSNLVNLRELKITNVILNPIISHHITEILKKNKVLSLKFINLINFSNGNMSLNNNYIENLKIEGQNLKFLTNLTSNFSNLLSLELISVEFPEDNFINFLKERNIFLFNLRKLALKNIELGFNCFCELIENLIGDNLRDLSFDLNFNVYNALKKKNLHNLKLLEIQETFYKFDKNSLVQLLKENTSLINLNKIKLGPKQHILKEIITMINFPYLEKF